MADVNFWASIWPTIVGAVNSLIDPALLTKARDFGIVSGVLSATIFALDGLAVVARGKSVLGETHGWRTLWMTPLWFVGGFMAGALGVLIKIYDNTFQAAILAAISWPTFLSQAKLVSQREKEDTQN